MSNRNFHNIYLHRNRAISSVGLERCLDRAEVTGSNPVWPTNKKPHTGRCAAFFMPQAEACFQLGAVKKAVMQRSCKRLLFGYKGPRVGSFAGRQKIQWVYVNLMA